MNNQYPAIFFLEIISDPHRNLTIFFSVEFINNIANENFRYSKRISDPEQENIP